MVTPGARKPLDMGCFQSRHHIAVPVMFSPLLIPRPTRGRRQRDHRQRVSLTPLRRSIPHRGTPPRRRSYWNIRVGWRLGPEDAPSPMKRSLAWLQRRVIHARVDVGIEAISRWGQVPGGGGHLHQADGDDALDALEARIPYHSADGCPVPEAGECHEPHGEEGTWPSGASLTG